MTKERYGPHAELIKHSARGSRRFKCPCGKNHEWPSNPLPGKRVPDYLRDIYCECGRVHSR